MIKSIFKFILISILLITFGVLIFTAIISATFLFILPKVLEQIKVQLPQVPFPATSTFFISPTPTE